MAEYKDIAPLKEQIADIKKAIHSPNSDYLTGYLCALSATEGVIAYLPASDVVEVVRCKDCKHTYFLYSCGKYMCKKGCGATKSENDFCSHGERKE